MKYYVTDCITGTIEGVEPVGTLEEAVSIRDEWNAKRKADGGSDEFWIILDEKGTEINTNIPVYLYGMRLRGFSVGCQPMEGFVERIEVPVGKYYDILIYDRMLTQKELDDYELDYLCTGNDTYYYEDGSSIVCIEDGQVTELVGEAAEEQRRLFEAIFR